MSEQTASVDKGRRTFDPQKGKDRKITRRQLLTAGGRASQAQAIVGAAAAVTAAAGTIAAVAVGAETLREAWTDGSRRSEAQKFQDQTKGWLEGNVEIDLNGVDFRTAPYVNQHAPNENKVPLGQITKIGGKEIRGKTSITLERLPYVESSDPEGRFGERSDWFIIRDTEEGILGTKKDFILFVSQKDDAVRTQGNYLPIADLGKHNLSLDQLGAVVDVK